MLDDETSKRKRSTQKGLLVVSLIDIILHKIMNTIKKKSVQFTLEIYQMMLQRTNSCFYPVALSCFLIGGWTTIS